MLPSKTAKTVLNILKLLYIDLVKDSRDLQKMFHFLNDWCKKWCVRVNVDKSNVMHLELKFMPKLSIHLYFCCLNWQYLVYCRIAYSKYFTRDTINTFEFEFEFFAWTSCIVFKYGLNLALEQNSLQNQMIGHWEPFVINSDLIKG